MEFPPQSLAALHIIAGHHVRSMTCDHTLDRTRPHATTPAHTIHHTVFNVGGERGGRDTITEWTRHGAALVHHFMLDVLFRHRTLPLVRGRGCNPTHRKLVHVAGNGYAKSAVRASPPFAYVWHRIFHSISFRSLFLPTTYIRFHVVLPTC